MGFTFNTSEIISYLQSIGLTFTASSFEEDFTSQTVTNRDANIWFQCHLGEESAHYFFHEMECNVSQNLTLA
jgi:hypothetical protein